jgi:hypothetical protein
MRTSMADHELAARRAPARPPISIARAMAACAWIAFAAHSSCTTSPSSGAPVASDCLAFEPRPIGQKTTAVPRAQRRGVSWDPGRKFEHVLIVVFENEDYDAVVREPYFGGLARRGALFTHYNAPFHPSYPNYLALIGGKFFGSSGDDQLDIPASERTIADLLEPKGLTWRQYAEAYPGGCYRGEAAAGPLYRRKHVPFLSFDSVAKRPSRCASIVPALAFDRKNLPNFAFYSPDMCHDGHDLCGNAYDQVKSAIRSLPGARYLGIVPPKLLQSASWLEGFLEPILADRQVMKDTLVVVTFDESRTDDNNHIYTAFLGDMVRPGARIDDCHDHYDLLRTIEENFGLGTLGGEDEISDPIVGGVWREPPR